MSRLLTAREVGERLGVSAETVLRWTRRGDLPALRLPSATPTVGNRAAVRVVPGRRVMTRFTEAQRRVYRSFVEELVAEAIADARNVEGDVTAETIARHVRWDSELVDALIQERIVEVTS